MVLQRVVYAFILSCFLLMLSAINFVLQDLALQGDWLDGVGVFGGSVLLSICLVEMGLAYFVLKKNSIGRAILLVVALIHSLWLGVSFVNNFSSGFVVSDLLFELLLGFSLATSALLFFVLCLSYFYPRKYWN